MFIRDFGLDTITLAGPLAAKLRAMRDAGFSQVMLAARDLVGHPEGWRAAVAEVRASGLRVTGFQVLRDFEGLSGHSPARLHDYKVDVAKAMIEMAAALGSPVLLACSSTSQHASGDLDDIARDLRKLAMLALPHGIRVAYEALSWGRHVNELPQAWAAVQRADCPNLGVGVDSYHIFATNTPLSALDPIPADRIFLVQLSDFMWQEVRTPEERLATARTFRVFPGEGVHSDELARLALALHHKGWRGDISFEVFNDDYQQLPLEFVTERGRRAALWLADQVLRRSAPLPLPHPGSHPRRPGPLGAGPPGSA